MVLGRCLAWTLLPVNVKHSKAIFRIVIELCAYKQIVLSANFFICIALSWHGIPTRIQPKGAPN